MKLCPSCQTRTLARGRRQCSPCAWGHTVKVRRVVTPPAEGAVLAGPALATIGWSVPS